MNLRTGIVVLLMLGAIAFSQPAVAASKPADFNKTIRSLFDKYCLGCHGEKKKGDLDLRGYTDLASAKKSLPTFQKLAEYLETREMPPEGKPQPSSSERKLLIAWVQTEVLGCDCDHPDPGRVTIRRLNRAEYNNTVRDLTGVNLQPADDFPADDVGYGFDNIGDVLSVSPMLFEKYMAASAKIIDAAFRTNSNGLNTASSKIFVREPTASTTNDAARETISKFAGRAYRRPISGEELDRLMKIFRMVVDDGGSYESGIKMALRAVLVSPNFLFRGELQPEPDNPQSIHPVNDYALASRLSYFLWNSMPDDELFALAAKRKLGANLEPQVKRMLRDPRARTLVDDFAEQWLEIRGLAMAAPDKAAFPEFDDELRNAMASETELFCEYVWKQDRSVLEFIDSDYTFLNERLARLYGIPGITGDEFQRVTLKTKERGGLLTQASILTVTSTATRTAPVKRGKWVLDNILGTPPPPPLADVPPLKEGSEEALHGTLRQRMEQHRADPSCAACHARMDPIGFGFENYNGIGAWRATEGEFPIDAAGQLLTGETFNGAAEFKRMLLTRKKDQFVRCLSEKMLTYALGRGLETYDKCAVDDIVASATKNNYRFSSLVVGVVKSPPFLMRRGEQTKATQ